MLTLMISEIRMGGMNITKLHLKRHADLSRLPDHLHRLDYEGGAENPGVTGIENVNRTLNDLPRLIAL